MNTPAQVLIPNPEGEPSSFQLPPSDYPPDTVLAALAIHAETGNAAEAARQTGVSPALVGKWINSDFGTKIAGALLDTLRVQFATRHRAVLDKALAAVMDRLDNGDPVVTKQGIRYVPVRARDGMLIASIAQDKYLALTATVSQTAKVDQLEQLAARLEAAANKQSNKHTQLATISPGQVGGPTAPDGTGGGENNKEGKFA